MNSPIVECQLYQKRVINVKPDKNVIIKSYKKENRKEKKAKGKCKLCGNKL